MKENNYFIVSKSYCIENSSLYNDLTSKCTRENIKTFSCQILHVLRVLKTIQFDLFMKLLLIQVQQPLLLISGVENDTMKKTMNNENDECDVCISIVFPKNNARSRVRTAGNDASGAMGQFLSQLFFYSSMKSLAKLLLIIFIALFGDYLKPNYYLHIYIISLFLAFKFI